MKPDTHTLEKVLEEGKVFKTRYKTKSKSKTFEKLSHPSDVYDFLHENLETNFGSDELKHKYSITITKIEDGQ